MKFGVREICDVVLKAKANQKVGNKIFYKHEPVIYFDTLKTSSMEGAATTVYAQGGRGNARLAAWEGERTVTFTMEDALISPEGFMILSGAGLIEAGTKDGKETTIKQHATQTIEKNYVVHTEEELDDSDNVKTPESYDIPLNYKPYSMDGEDYIYVFLMKEGEIISEPYIGTPITVYKKDDKGDATSEIDFEGVRILKLSDSDYHKEYNPVDWKENFEKADAVMVDYYIERATGAKQIEITADQFGGNYYLEASTLFRDTNGVDMPAEFIIPNCKIQSNFTFTMASSGDPSTFTFTMDAFPDYTRFDRSKKVLAAIQIIEESGDIDSGVRTQTWA